ncbi:PTS sugar transporter subunit IIB [Olsenella sp. Marseille-P4559]|uniref:PTS system mannose/fructose/N-acetylgalactosamine-transporter subunit IIB n=1 Tax=Olsenella sp. Marseille-P4559 TaxID=2364795 RepID=UPI0010320EEA|nr:PTS sugar transporter subunit IIB [Olsenella sp. Marseille-P4559]
MSIVAARIDNRLLHGIVATQWVPRVKPQRVMVVDDEYAGDPTKKAGMRMAKPAGVALSIISEQTARDHFREGKYDDHTVFVIVRDPRIIQRLEEDGQKVPKLTIGGTVSPQEGQAATQVSRRAYVLDAEVPVYSSIAAHGTSIDIQYVPADKDEPLSKYIDL